MRTGRIQHKFMEHGYILTLFSARPKGIYTQGIPREFLKSTREDFYQRQLEFIGQQEVYVDEVYADSANGNQVFGYQDRYREYREGQPPMVTGEFRDSTLYDYHLGRIFASQPTLNASFVECNPSKRIFQEQTQDSIYILARHHIKAFRNVQKIAQNKIIQESL